MTIFKSLAAILVLTLSGSALHSQPASLPTPVSVPKKVYVIPIDDAIEDALTYQVRRGVKEAIENKADILVLHMDTPGGSVKSTLDILKILEKFPHQDQTYTFIDPWAVSAGALISAGTKNIYMSPSAIIGAAAPVVGTPTGGTEDMPSTIEEKHNSAIRAQIRAFAERNGHRPEVFNAMVDKDQGLTVDGKEIVPKGKIVTLTAKEALQDFKGKPLLSLGTFDNLDSFIAKIAGPTAVITKIEPTGFESLGRFLVFISPFLMGAALICGYIEFKTPGFGIFGLTAIACAILFFFGHFVAGLSGYENALFFLAGIVLIVVELFLFPGFILPGVIGLALVIFSLVRATIDLYPQDGFLPPLPAWEGALGQFGLSLVIAFVGILILARFLPKTSLYQDMILDATNTPLPPSLATAPLLGMRGLAITPLRPSGTARLGDDPIDVVTQGDFIEVGQAVEVIQVEGNRVVVTAVSPGSSV